MIELRKNIAWKKNGGAPKMVLSNNYLLGIRFFQGACASDILICMLSIRIILHFDQTGDQIAVSHHFLAYYLDH